MVGDSIVLLDFDHYLDDDGYENSDLVGQCSLGDEFNFILAHYEEKPPQPKTEEFEIPYGEDLDITDDLGLHAFGRRTMTIDCLVYAAKHQDFMDTLSALKERIQGVASWFWLSFDPEWLYYGRFAVTSRDYTQKKYGHCTIEINCETYKYKLSGYSSTTELCYPAIYAGFGSLEEAWDGCNLGGGAYNVVGLPFISTRRNHTAQIVRYLSQYTTTGDTSCTSKMNTYVGADKTAEVFTPTGAASYTPENSYLLEDGSMYSSILCDAEILDPAYELVSANEPTSDHQRTYALYFDTQYVRLQYDKVTQTLYIVDDLNPQEIPDWMDEDAAPDNAGKSVDVEDPPYPWTNETMNFYWRFTAYDTLKGKEIIALYFNDDEHYVEVGGYHRLSNADDDNIPQIKSL